jgi:uncharacterized protein (TIGR01777 family)
MSNERIVITGATGLVGLPLSRSLIARGREVVVLSRDPDAARKKVPGAADYFEWSPGASGPWTKAIDGAGAVISMAGEPLFRHRLTQAKYEAAMATRIRGVRGLVAAMEAAANRPAAFLVGSSVGIYGFQGPDDAVVTERTEPGRDYHATSNIVWEHAALPASWMGVRTVLLRTGIVWGRDGGMAFNQLSQFRRGWGNVIGAGTNWLPWIHIDDEVGVIEHVLERDDLHGAFNLSAPQPVQFRDYAGILGELVNKPVKRTLPAWTVKLYLGRTSDMVLHNRRMLPDRIVAAGYRFRHPDAREALRDLFPNAGK